LYPTTPHVAAGQRIEPPMSDPVVSVDVPAARLAAEPPDDAPAVNRGSHGDLVAPLRRDVVIHAHANSGDVVRA
jgi:hypothetical protein